MMRLLLLLLAATPVLAFEPDPATVRRHGAGYRYPQHGWIVLHIEGEPYERGYQHGKLLSREIADYVLSLATQQSKAAPVDAWNITRTMVSALFLRKFDREYLEEMQGIAEGANAGGAKFDKRPLDLLDIVCINTQMEYETLDNAVEALPTGLEGVRFPKPPHKVESGPSKDHCSAFAATGPATKDGKMVIGHITMSGLANALASNVWIDVKPAKGHRIVMQGFPGAIWSAQDYYINDAGLVLTETTIRQTRFNGDGIPLTNRCRKALQYSNSIDDIVKVLVEKNNGLYTNEWLIGDANTNEIAMLELGTTKHKLRRSSKNEWLLKDAEGLYWGCNNTKDLDVRIDSHASLHGRPQDLSWRPSVRDKAWLKLYDAHRGKVDADFGKLAFATPPLAARPSLDAKVTTSDMAKKLESHALFGPPSHRVWEVTQANHDKYHEVRSLVPNDWTVIAMAAPKDVAPEIAIDFEDKLPVPFEDPHTVPAWKGTLLPKSDDDIWFTAGFAAYERIVALEIALTARSNGKLTDADKDRIALALFQYESAINHWSTPRSPMDWHGRFKPLLRDEVDRDAWHRRQVAEGVLKFYQLRTKLGLPKFIAMMEKIGQEHAGKEIQASKLDLTFDDLAILGPLKSFIPRVDNRNRHVDPIDGGAFARAQGQEVSFDISKLYTPRSVNEWMQDPDHTVIIYGTVADIAGNKAAAMELQKAFRVKWWNVDIAVMKDTDATDEKMKGNHVILIGRPEVNTVAKKHVKLFPINFKKASVRINGEVYAHERSAVIIANTSKPDPQYSMVLVAGNSADATYCAAQALVNAPSAQVLVMPRGNAPVPMLVKQK